MKIQRAKVTASASEELSKMVYDDAIQYIRKAIDSLGAAARKDPDNKAAKEAIANLGVVLLDLKK